MLLYAVLQAAVVAVRFCPVLYALPEGGGAGDADSPLQLPYHMVFAVATQDSVIIYDTLVPPSLFEPST